MNTAFTLEDKDALIDFAIGVRRRSNLELKRILISEQVDWKIKGGFLSHKTNGFFHISGFKDDNPTTEELVLYQPQGAFNGLLVAKSNGTAYVLIHARVEPGNAGVVQFGPTIQSTPANYMRLHKGKPTPYLNYFFGASKDAKPIYQSSQFDLGKRYFQKSKVLSYVETQSLSEPAQNMVWVPIKILAELAKENQFVNTDLRSMIGVFNWGEYLDKNIITSSHEEVVKSATQHYPSGKLVDLRSLTNWTLTDDGVLNNRENGVEAHMFEASCNGREVQKWTQPLICASSKGQVVLLITYISGKLFFAVSHEQEFGISGGYVMMPTFTKYPGSGNTRIKIEGNHVISVDQSEEGGRFYQNINTYEIWEVGEDYSLEAHHTWYSVSAFKKVLSTSNLVSIQLRCCASLLLEALHPEIFMK